MDSTTLKPSIKNQDAFNQDYYEIVDTSMPSVATKTEWKSQGDVFQKFTMYDSNYKIMPTLKHMNSTTLINKI